MEMVVVVMKVMVQVNEARSVSIANNENKAPNKATGDGDEDG